MRMPACAKLWSMPCHPSRDRAPALVERTAPIPLLVLDTNVVLDWVAFRDPRVQRIVAAIEGGSLRPVTSAACLQELRRALGYAQVKLDAAAQARAFERYLGHARVSVKDGGDATQVHLEFTLGDPSK